MAAAGSLQMAAIVCRAAIRPIATTVAIRTRQTTVLGGSIPFTTGRPASMFRSSQGRVQDSSAKEEEQKLIWEGYKRRHKGQIPPKKTRLRCKRNIAKGVCGNPCPLCANDIEIKAKDVALLNQFICPHSGKILQPSKTGLCRLQQKKLVAAIEEAWDYGYIPRSIPRHYNIS